MMLGMDSSQIIDVRLAKALRNPMRQAILAELRSGGPHTATTLAEQLDVTTGATSYNLRVLAKHGLVEEVERDGSARKRWWRAAVTDLRLPDPRQRGRQVGSKMDDLVSGWAEHDLAMFARLLSTPRPGSWAELPFSRGTLTLTTSQLQAFFEDYLALVQRYRRATLNPDPGAELVQLRFIAFPDPGAPTEGDSPAAG